MQELDVIFGRAYAALDTDDVDGVQAAMAAAIEAGAGEDDVRLRYLEFICGWLDEDATEDELEQLVAETDELLENAAALANADEAARIVIDVADVLASIGDHDEAEHALRSLSERGDIEPETDGDARMLRAAILLEHLEDPDEALATLDGIDGSLHEKLGYVSLRAAVLLDLDRLDDAIELLEDALARDDDTELHYQLGIVLRESDQPEAAAERLLLVRKRDLDRHGIDPRDKVPDDEAEDLRRHLEDVLDTLPEPVLAHLATAAIRIERWASPDAIRDGCDPRSVLTFEGRPASDDDDDDDDDEGRVEAIVIFRDALVAQIEDDDDIIELLALGLVEEADRFLDVELIPGM